jgi:hypothetical protein
MTSSRATSSRAGAIRSTSSDLEDGGTFAAAERGQGVATGANGDYSGDASSRNHEQDDIGGNGRGIVDESTSDAVNREQFAQDESNIGQSSLGQSDDGQSDNGQAMDGEFANGSASQLAASQLADSQLADGQVDARDIDDQVADGQMPIADGQIADGQIADSEAGDEQIADEVSTGSLADGEDLNMPADNGAAVADAAESSPEVLEQGVPFAEGEGENADGVGSPAIADNAPTPAPVLIGDRGPAKTMRILPNARANASVEPTTTTSTTTKPTATASTQLSSRQSAGKLDGPANNVPTAIQAGPTTVMPVSASAGLTRRVLPMGPPSNIPHRSLPALPPRKVEAKATSDVVMAATGTSTASSSGAVAPASNAGNVVLTAAQPGPAGPPAAASESGETPLRNAAFCRRLYNERNCCSDENACNDHRAHVKSHPLSKISLDITPTCNLTSRQEGNQANCGFPFEQSPSRIWRDRKGVEVARGRVTGFAHLRVEVTDDKGIPTRIRLRDLNEDDICFLAAWCGVPSECRLDDVALAARNWTPITMTWKASSLCHKPLYFEEEQLERYGHTMGPFAQPVVSGAHFFANIALLPYNMGIHPMSECQYALGYYRPGSCAPWMIPPFPLSARGALAETGVILGGIYLIP